MRRAARVLVVSLLVLASVSAAGCTTPEDAPRGDGESGTRLPDDAPPPWNVTFTGRVTDARSGTPLPLADVRVELVTGDPCGGSSTRVAWNAWSVNLRGDGTFGPVTLPAPQGNASFQVHASAPGHLDAAREYRAEPRTNASLHVPLALVPAGAVTLPFADAGDARGTHVTAWWTPGQAAAFRVSEDAGNVTTATGLVHGATLTRDGTLVPWTADAPEDGHANATRVNASSSGALDRVDVHVRDQRGNAAAGAVVLALDPVTEHALALAVTNATGRAVVHAPGNASVTVHVAFPSPVVQRATRVVDAGADALVEVTASTSACA